MVLTHAKVDFTNEIITNAGFKKLQKEGKLPNSQVPIFNDGCGDWKNQSMAICIKIAKKYGLWSEDPIEIYHISNAMEIINDFYK